MSDQACWSTQDPSGGLGGGHLGVPGSGANADTGAVVLGLQTLGSFDFEGHSLLGFVQHCATHYLHSEEKLIRSYNFIHMVSKICSHCFFITKTNSKALLLFVR